MNLTVNVGESAYSQIRKMKGQDDLDSFHGNKPVSSVICVLLENTLFNSKIYTG